MCRHFGQIFSLCFFFSFSFFSLLLSRPPPNQFTPAIRPCLQTLAIGLVAFGENYRRHQSGIGQPHLACRSSASPSIHSIIQRLYPSRGLRCSTTLDSAPFDVMWVWAVDALSSLVVPCGECGSCCAGLWSVFFKYLYIFPFFQNMPSCIVSESWKNIFQHARKNICLRLQRNP